MNRWCPSHPQIRISWLFCSIWSLFDNGWWWWRRKTTYRPAAGFAAGKNWRSILKENYTLHRNLTCNIQDAYFGPKCHLFPVSRGKRWHFNIIPRFCRFSSVWMQNDVIFQLFTNWGILVVLFFRMPRFAVLSRIRCHPPDRNKTGKTRV